MTDDHVSQQGLGFSYHARKNGEVEVRRQGKVVSLLRGRDAAAFLAKVEAGDEAAAQQLLARITGNYRRGNERLASHHARNRP
ncbi:hypothetical protein HNQ59_002614 [Chitinivorax tropicus]|uniref:Uncharacterized protein n=1 Tax=Chitinivorax tropicus TaxID=714531 RepID=A0A840MSC9_9PROT|nr:hypothetical protein [Chitinivorax tropicus]MBB5019316.1 hypothetical protein [Chitinivorax tropicus]